MRTRSIVTAPNMKRFFRIVLLLILIVGGVWWVTNHKDSASGSKADFKPVGTYTPVTEAPVLAKDVPLLQQVNREYVRVSQAVIPSVVNVLASRPAQPSVDLDGVPFMLPFPQTPNAPQTPSRPAKPGAKKKAPTLPKEPSVGSGVIISKEGHIITNCHVIKDADDIIVYLHDNRRYKAKLLASDELADVAVLKIEADNLQPLAWGDSSTVQIGEQVFAIGNPFGLSESVSLGIVSAKGRNPSRFTTGANSNSYEDFIQTTAAINPGNSGGALVNIQGELIGINTAIQSTSRGFQGIGFAIPSNLARFAFESLIKSGKVTRGYLGVTIQELSPNDLKFFKLQTEAGALVTEVEPSSPAGKIGLQSGDVIVSFNASPVRDPAELRLAVSQTPVGKEVPIGVIRDGKPMTFTFKVAEMTPDVLSKLDAPAEEAPTGPAVETLDNFLGALHVEDLTPASRRTHKLKPTVSGVLVTSVEEGSTAEAEGVHPGDVIEQLRIEGQYVSTPVPDVKAFYALGRKLKKDQGVLLLLRRGRITTFVSLTPES
ncbi:MAG: hypothetical protein B9S32_11000 [Verrucomicrobia bacterium Tous-C9LFEB]|nr:MAG: hypothetical protein B9S32_11000 [Verrucomicrobia bacterium Tous-C9LFEB]